MLFYNVRETQELWETRTSPLAWPRTLTEIAYGVEAAQPSSCLVFLSCIRFLVPKTIRFSSKLQLMTVSAVTCCRSSKRHGLISAYWQRSGALPRYKSYCNCPIEMKIVLQQLRLSVCVRDLTLAFIKSHYPSKMHFCSIFFDSTSLFEKPSNERSN